MQKKIFIYHGEYEIPKAPRVRGEGRNFTFFEHVISIIWFNVILKTTLRQVSPFYRNSK